MKATLTACIKQTALEIGFDAIGVAQADFLREDAPFFKSWLDRGYQAEMAYLERNQDKRLDPRELVEGCKSVIVVLMNYYPTVRQPEGAPLISKYSYSAVDYHTVIKEKLLVLEIEFAMHLEPNVSITNSNTVLWTRHQSWSDDGLSGQVWVGLAKINC